MALSRQKKEATVQEVHDLLARSKLTVYARYQGSSVPSMQELRSQAKESGTMIRVIKNRLFKKALAATSSLKDIHTRAINGQLVYAFNDNDEAAPAQILASFAKTNPQIEFVGAITADGQLLDVEDLKSLAALPTKDQLRGHLLVTINSPFSGVANVLSENLRSVLHALNARTHKLTS